MKQLSSLIFAFFYFALTIGAQYDAHYCGGKLIGTAVSLGTGYPAEKTKCVCGAENKTPSGCCSDESKTFQIEDGHQKAEFGFDFSGFKIQPTIAAVLPSLFSWPQVSQTGFSDGKNERLFYPDSLFRFPKTSLYLLHCVFRI